MPGESAVQWEHDGAPRRPFGTSGGAFMKTGRKKGVANKAPISRRVPGKKRPSPTQVIDDVRLSQAIELRAAGVSYNTIAEKFGVSTETVRRRVIAAVDAAAKQEVSGSAVRLVMQAVARIEHVLKNLHAEVADPKVAAVYLAANQQFIDLFGLRGAGQMLADPDGASTGAPGEKVSINIHMAGPPGAAPQVIDVPTGPRLNGE